MERTIAVDKHVEALPKHFRIIGWVLAILPLVIMPWIRDPTSEGGFLMLLFGLVGAAALFFPYLIASVSWNVISLVLWVRAKRHDRSMGPKSRLALVVVIASQVGLIAYVVAQS